MAAELEQLNSRRDSLLSQIRRAFEQLTAGSAAPMAGLNLQPDVAPRRRRGGRRKGFKMSAEARAKIAAAAKKRWAERKKQG